MRLSRQVALVTGGGSGIGLVVADRFIVEGASVGAFVNTLEHADLLRNHQGSRVVVSLGDARNPQDKGHPLPVQAPAAHRGAAQRGRMDLHRTRAFAVRNLL